MSPKTEGIAKRIGLSKPAASASVLVGCLVVLVAVLVVLHYRRTSSSESKPRPPQTQVPLNLSIRLELSEIDLESDARTANALARASAGGDCSASHRYAMWLLTPSELAAIRAVRRVALRTVLLDAASKVQLLDDARSRGECDYVKLHVDSYAADIARAAAGLRAHLARS
jgi:hypothetical protein